MALTMNACKTTTRKLPKGDFKFYAGSSDLKSILREQQKERVRCDDPYFDSFICMTDDDLMKFIDTYIGKCDRWEK